MRPVSIVPRAAWRADGPAKGTLVIVGGGSTSGTTIMEKFVELGGGVDGKFVIVPTAGGNRGRDGAVTVYQEEQILGSWRRRGLKNVVMLHTHDPKVADTDDFVAPLKDATAVWFNGGRQWNIVDSYAGTKTYKEFHKVLERGGVTYLDATYISAVTGTALLSRRLPLVTPTGVEEQRFPWEPRAED